MPRKINQILLLLFTIFYCNVFAQVTPNKPSGVITKIAGSNLSCGSNWLNVKDASSVFRAGDLDITGNKLTIEAVFNRTQSSNSGNIVSKHKDSKDVNYLLRPNRAEITTTNGFFNTPDICEAEFNKTYHVAMTYDGNTLKFYRNGFLMSQVLATGNLITNDWLTTIGDLAYSPGFNNETLLGYINEVRIWNVARTQDQIKAYINIGLPNPQSQQGLLAYYIFDNLKNKEGNIKWDGILNGNSSIQQYNPTCDSYLADSCGTIPFIEPVVNAGFTIPDTVCVSTPVTINNTTTNGTNFYWNFCVADINQIPESLNLGNPGNKLSSPVFIDLAQDDNGDYYAFSINHIPGELIRYNFGNSYLNNPVVKNLGNFGGDIPNQAEGIQIIKSNGIWYGVIVGGGNNLSNSSPRLVVINFGTSLSNTPSSTNWGNIGNLNQPIDLHVFNEGNSWYGFTVNALNNTITRFDFADDFNTAPNAVNLGGFGFLNYPDGIYVINDNGYWRAFVTNSDNSSVTRLDFGNSLLNPPSAVSLGNPGNLLNKPRDILIIKFCEQTIGFVVNAGTNELVKLNFGNDLGIVK